MSCATASTIQASTSQTTMKSGRSISEKATPAARPDTWIPLGSTATVSRLSAAAAAPLPATTAVAFGAGRPVAMSGSRCTGRLITPARSPATGWVTPAKGSAAVGGYLNGDRVDGGETAGYDC